MKLDLMILSLCSDKPIKESASQIRGFFASQFNEYILLHQHNAEKVIYEYPRVQYKVISENQKKQKKAMIIGINEGATVLKEIYDKFDTINLNSNKYEIIEKGIAIKELNFGMSDNLIKYKFVTPYFALNQKNYIKYNSLDHREKKQLLDKILIGNILSMSKSLNYTIPDSIKSYTELKLRKSSLKGVPIATFIGTFLINFEIPNLLGIGKSVSRGFGTVKQYEL